MFRPFVSIFSSPVAIHDSTSQSLLVETVALSSACVSSSVAKPSAASTDVRLSSASDVSESSRSDELKLFSLVVSSSAETDSL